MYGSVMMKAFGNGRSAMQSDNDNAFTGKFFPWLSVTLLDKCKANHLQSVCSACQIFNIGRFLATTEIRSADRYWHVYSPKRDIIYRE